LPTVSPETAAKVETAAQSTQAAAAATLVSNVIMSGAMSQVWGMINGLQIIVYLPMFAIIPRDFPSLTIMMIGNLIDIATFDVLPSVDAIEATLSPPSDELEEERFN